MEQLFNFFNENRWLLVPMLIWTIGAVLVFFDIRHQKNIRQRHQTQGILDTSRPNHPQSRLKGLDMPKEIAKYYSIPESVLAKACPEEYAAYKKADDALVKAVGPRADDGTSAAFVQAHSARGRMKENTWPTLTTFATRSYCSKRHWQQRASVRLCW